MKAISLRQPWAWLVVEGHKPVEFRSRSSKFRGECYIHASMTFDQAGYDWIMRHPDLPGRDQLYNYKPGQMDFGALIGKVIVTDCMPVDQAREVFPNSAWGQAAGDTLGKYAIILEKMVHFPPEECIPCRGKVFPLFFEPEIPVKDYYKAIRDDQPDLLGL